ncbi:tetratricopeptide repeat protein [Frigidibacter sp. MR17.14]|uniref:tetratricopeptide repeat protein n=1 Tax=Frigidibacter sp. MR17.14 TaxID=3126509 RepID=UPI003012CD19
MSAVSADRRAAAAIARALVLALACAAPPATASEPDPCDPAAALAGPTRTDISRRVVRAYVERTSAGNLTRAEQAVETLVAERSDFCAAFDLGRFYVSTGRPDEAIAALQTAVRLEGTDRHYARLAARNALGYALMQVGALDAAGQRFEEQLDRPDTLTPEMRVRVLNNLGTTLMLAGQFDAAEQRLADAAEEGSTLALRRLETLATLRSDLDAAGAEGPALFGTVLASARTEAEARDMLQAATRALDDERRREARAARDRQRDRRPAAEPPPEPPQLSVFQTGTDVYVLVLSAWSSLPQATALQHAAFARRFPGGYVSGLAQWRDVTARFPAAED